VVGGDGGETFDDMVFMDEPCFRNKGMPAEPKPRVKHPYKVQVWAGISKILIFPGIMKKKVFVESIQRNILPFLMETFPDGHRFQQDNDPKHKSTNSTSDKPTKQPPNQITAKRARRSPLQQLQVPPINIAISTTQQNTAACKQIFHSFTFGNVYICNYRLSPVYYDSINQNLEENDELIAVGK